MRQTNKTPSRSRNSVCRRLAFQAVLRFWGLLKSRNLDLISVSEFKLRDTTENSLIKIHVFAWWDDWKCCDVLMLKRSPWHYVLINERQLFVALCKHSQIQFKWSRKEAKKKKTWNAKKQNKVSFCWLSNNFSCLCW